ncbi:MAG: uroporphyrinogen-III synthase [Alphaproteobacteria bacterium]|nr:uroporphyrinogen-III synthase [Alphaproteobacteria bacterium]
MSSNPDVHVLLTRPAAQAATYKAELEAQFGLKIHVTLSPLLHISVRDDPILLDGTDVLLFTSVNGVKAFGQASDRRDIPCFCVGDKTTIAAQHLGLSAISATGSLPDLVELVTRKAGIKPFSTLHLRGAEVAGNLVKQLTRSEIDASEQIIYDQELLPLNDNATSLLSGPSPVVIPLFSPRTARAFSAEIENLSTCELTAICISANVASALDPLKFRSPAHRSR